MGTVTVRLYEELNDHLPQHLRKHDFSFALPGTARVKEILDALKVPEAEVDLILVNGAAVPWRGLVRPGDRVSVYPVFERFDIRSVTRLRRRPLRRIRFVAFEAALEPFARLMRLLGFDVLWNQEFAGPSALDERQMRARILVHTARARVPQAPRRLHLPTAPVTLQVRRAITELQIEAALRPLSRCPQCNHPFPSSPPGRGRSRGRRFPCERCGLSPWSRQEASRALSLARTIAKADAATGITASR